MTVLEQLTRRTTQHDRRLSALEARETASALDPVWAYNRAVEFLIAQGVVRGIWKHHVNYWPPSARNMSFNGHSSTYPMVYVDSDRYFPFIRCRGAQTQYLYHTGSGWSCDSQTYQNNPGLTAGAWIKLSSIYGSAMGIVGAWDGAASNQSWLLMVSGTTLRGLASDDGDVTDNSVTMSSPDPVPTGRWLFAAYRWTPSTELKIWLFDADTTYTATLTTSIVSSLYYDTGLTGFIGTYEDDTPTLHCLDGDISLPFFSATAWSDATIQKVFDMSRHIYGV